MMELRVRGVQTIPTYEIAGMMDRTHGKVIRMLEGDKTHVGIIPTLNEAQLGVVNFFIESTYKDAKGQPVPVAGNTMTLQDLKNEAEDYAKVAVQSTMLISTR